MRHRAPGEHVERLRLGWPADFEDLLRRAARWDAASARRCTAPSSKPHVAEALAAEEAS